MWAFKRLRVWQSSVELVEMTYRVTARYPPDERFGLVTQTRRAANSIGANIAEGAGRNSSGEFAQFLGYAKGSLSELEHHLILARKLEFLDDTDFGSIDRELQAIGGMITRLRQSVTDGRHTPNA